MSSQKKMKPSTEDCLQKIEKLKREIDNADAIMIGAGAGLSTSAGLTYDGKRFRKYFSDFEEKYGFHDMYTGGFYPYKTPEEYWSFWSRFIYYNRYDLTPAKVYEDLLCLVKDNNYFVITTNVDHQFQIAGFDKHRLFYTQGDYGLFQCSVPCHQKTYSNEESVRKMLNEQKDMKIPTELIPICPRCGEPMAMNLRSDYSFVEDAGWEAASERYNKFLDKYKRTNILFLELGVGYNTPGIIKYPFWQMTFENAKAKYACINNKHAGCPDEIESQSICIQGDIRDVLDKLLSLKEENKEDA